MSIQGILQQMLQSAQGMVQGPDSPDSRNTNGMSASTKGFAGGALTGGALALLLGNKKFRKMGGSLAAYGGMAALGAVAYRAYDSWQKKESAQSPSAAAVSQPYLQLPNADLERHSRIVVAAMLAAAKADGHIGPQEQELLDTEFRKFQATPEDQRWLAAQLNGPADPVAIAKLVSTPEEGAEVYLASVLITGADSFMERAYLDELARQLQLEPGLQEHLENTALQS